MNPAMKRVYEKCGYQHEGVARANVLARRAGGMTPICMPCWTRNGRIGSVVPSAFGAGLPTPPACLTEGLQHSWIRADTENPFPQCYHSS